MEQYYGNNDDLQFEKKGDFDIMVIKPNNIEKYDYNNPGYIVNLVKQPFVEITKTSSDKFLDDLAVQLDIDNFESEDRNIETNVVYDKSGYFYEILYLKVTSKMAKPETENQFSSLICTDDKKIYGNMILLKTKMPNDETSMSLIDIDKSDLFEILDSRVNTKVVVLEDDEYRIETVRGDMDVFCKNLFGEEYYKKKEIMFLNHNLNIWYITNEYGTDEISNLVDGKVEIAVFFTMISEEYRGNITLEEINKIVKLSNVMDNFSLKKEWVSEEKDSLDRKIIKNKFRVLEYAWKEYIKKD